MRPIATFLLAGVLGSPSAMAQDRADAMLRAFQDACFPHLNDLTVQRQKITGAGFVQVPRESVQELRQLNAFMILTGAVDGQKPLFETYRGQRPGFDLVAYLLVRMRDGVRSTACGIYDFGAPGRVGDKKLADWIGRPADNLGEGASDLRWRATTIVALPGGYGEIASDYSAGQAGRIWAGALLSATVEAQGP